MRILSKFRDNDSFHSQYIFYRFLNQLPKSTFIVLLRVGQRNNCELRRGPHVLKRSGSTETKPNVNTWAGITLCSKGSNFRNYEHRDYITVTHVISAKVS